MMAVNISYIVNYCWVKSPSYISKRFITTSRKIEKLLIANRGEIACRIMRTARRHNIKTVAVYSEADQHSLHVSMADEAYKIGPAAAAQSYLRGDHIIEIAKNAKCHAIHPGYGFLSENVEFAENCQKHNVIFIGPPASAIRDMGIKSTSKAIMSNAGVPIIEGYHGSNQSNSKLKEEARKIGYPVMIKAVRGGGGKGMRIALTETEFEEALESARTEAQKSFGDSIVLLEKYVAEPRHVEVQIFADTHGNAVHLFERDCSVQRRHQKIIEEAPAPGLSTKLRNELGAAAVRAAKAVGYVGAGTVEFILDRKTHSFHFMEMNTRLQVEHPITEMITGTDLVGWQINVASGEKLPLTQDEIKLNGHAFEARIYAEDPRGGFLPGAGELLHLTTPDPGTDVRIETGVRQGDEVSIYYDPMIAKLVVWGRNRHEALRKLRSKLQEYNIAGLETNVNFLLDLAKHKEFESGNVHTNFINDNYDSLFTKEILHEDLAIQAALAVVLNSKHLEMQLAKRKLDHFNPFNVESSFRVNHQHQREINLKFKDEDVKVLIKFGENDEFEMSSNGGATWRIVNGKLSKSKGKICLRSSIDDIQKNVHIFINDKSVVLFNENGKTEFSLPKPKFLIESGEDLDVASLNKATSPMPGILDKIFVKKGDNVKKGDSLFVLIAMKMEHVVKASRDAGISDVFYKVGDNVSRDAVIVKYNE